MTSWMFPSVVATLVGSLVLCFVYSFLYQQDKDAKHLLIWTAAWAVYSLRFVFLLGALLQPSLSLLPVLAHVVSLTSGVMLLWGTYEFVGKRFPDGWWWATLAGIGWISITSAMNTTDLILTLPTFLFLGGVYIWMGVVLWHSKELPRGTRHMTGAGFILWGIHKMDYPFLHMVVWFAPWGYLLGALLEFVVALGTLLVYFGKNQQSLRTSETMMLQLTNTINEAFWLRDVASQEILYVSDSYESIFGQPSQSLMANPQSFLANVHPADLPRVQQAMTQHVDITYRIVEDDGSLRWIAARTFPVKNAEGAVYRVAGVAEDVTHKKQAEQALLANQQRVDALLRMTKQTTLTADELIAFALEEMVTFTESEVGFFHFFDANENTIRFGMWSQAVMAQCKIMDSYMHLPLNEAGIWADCVRERQPIIAAEGFELPQGHFSIEHHMSVPIFENEAIVAVVGVANRPTVYQPEDAEQLSLLANAAWEIIARREAEESLDASEHRFQIVVESMDDIIYTLDTEMRHTGVFGDWVERSGLTPDHFIGKTVSEILGPEMAKDHLPPTRRALQGERTVYEWSRPDPEGEMYYQTSLSPIYDQHHKGVVGVVGVGRDITKRKRAENALRRHHAHLEELVKERTRNLEEANQRLTELSSIKDQFVSNVSHELRSPITSIKLRLHMLRNDPTRLSKYLATLERETRRLSQTIESLLTISRLDQGRVNMAMEAINLNELLPQYVEDRALIAAQKNIDLQGEYHPNLPPILGNHDLLSQAINVFLSNALNYTPAGGNVAIGTTQRHLDDGAQVGFFVKDTGMGIPLDEQSRLFERFYRGRSSREMQTEGTGLGLAIAHEIVNAHQGHIEVQSTGVPGEGATFKVWLPTDTL